MNFAAYRLRSARLGHSFPACSPLSRSVNAIQIKRAGKYACCPRLLGVIQISMSFRNVSRRLRKNHSTNVSKCSSDGKGAIDMGITGTLHGCRIIAEIGGPAVDRGEHPPTRRRRARSSLARRAPKSLANYDTSGNLGVLQHCALTNVKSIMSSYATVTPVSITVSLASTTITA